MAAHHWQDIEPPTFFAEAFCERCGLRRHVLGLERAVFVEEGAKRSWHPLPPPCPPPPPGPEDGRGLRTQRRRPLSSARFAASSTGCCLALRDRQRGGRRPP